jgi:hypothetical protein
MSSPTERSLAKIRKDGYTAAVTEHWNAFARIRQDLFGFIDIVAIKDTEPGVIGIQTTSKGNMQARILKIKREPVAKVWLASGNRIIVDGWLKKGLRYELTQYEITPDNIFKND